MLTRKAVLLGKVQTAIGTPATLSAATDGILVEDPTYSIDPTLLERNFTTNDLSPQEHVIGKKIASISFGVEMRGNGKQNSGVITDQPMLARLLNACGYDLVAVTTAADASLGVTPDGSNPGTTPEVSWAAGGTLSAGHTKPVVYTITKGSTNAITITNNDNEIDDGTGASATIVSGTPITLGECGVTLTPTFTGTIPTGAVFRVCVMPKGIKAVPISDGQKAITLEAYFDGIQHKIHDAHGTFSFNAEAGNYGKFNFTFTGAFNPTVDAALPDPTYEKVLPPQIELANFTWGANRELVVNALTFDQQNTISPRPDVNSPDGYKGVRITGRNPTGGMDPEAVTVSAYDFWGEFATAKAKSLVFRAGNTPGNIVGIWAPRVQTSNLGYGDRDGIRTYDQSLAFKRNEGDDESVFIFC